MKTMTCNELGGACDFEFRAETFDEIGELSKSHAMEMFQKGDKAHIEAMSKMSELMKDPAKMASWMNEKRQLFENKKEEQ